MSHTHPKLQRKLENNLKVWDVASPKKLTSEVRMNRKDIAVAFSRICHDHFLLLLLLVTKLYLTLCDPMDCSMPGFPVLHCLLEFAQTHVNWVDDDPFSCLQSFPASESLPMSRLFTSGGQIIGASASVSFLPVNIQGWFPLGLTGLISLLSKGLSRVFSSTLVWRHQFFSTQPSLCSSSYQILSD